MTTNRYEMTSFEATYDRYSDMLYRLALTNLEDAHDAEDAVQDVFIKYHKLDPSFRDMEHEKAWFIRVTINKCHDIRRARNHRTHVSLDQVSDLQAPREEVPDIVHTLKKIDEKYREVIVLHYFNDMSVEEIAKALRLSKSAVKMRLMRGRDMLKDELSKEAHNV